jgi:hypothetical protein
MPPEKLKIIAHRHLVEIARTGEFRAIAFAPDL